MEEPSHIVPMLCNRILTSLTDVCITNIESRDPTRMNDIKVGRFQEDPQKTMIRASIQGGDLEDPGLMDEIVDPEKSKNRLAFYAPAREIGGGQLWWRKGVIRLEMFFMVERPAVSEEEARERAYLVLGRIQQHIETIPVYDLTDQHGEKAIKLFHPRNSFYQSGGPPSSWIWRGKLIWECLTERP